MSLKVLDTDTLTLLRHGHREVSRRALVQPPGSVATTAITVEEQVSGWYAMLRKAKSEEALAEAYEQLCHTVRAVSQFPLLTFSIPAIREFERLKRMQLGVKAKDLRIAAIVLIHGEILVTRNIVDFSRIPGLVIENWADD